MIAEPDMVERVAKAIFAKDAVISRAYQMTGSDLWEDHKKRHPAYRAFARAAIEAMREPTDEMVQTACRKHVPGVEMSPGSGECVALKNAAFRWRSMIDAALASHPAKPSEAD